MKTTFLFSILAAVLLSGCYTVTTDVSKFHTIPKGKFNPPKTAYFESEPKTLEDAAYQECVFTEVKKFGLLKAQSKSSADYIISMRYGIDSGVYQSSTQPVFGVTNPGGPVSSSSYGYAGGTPVSLNTTSYQPATFGQVGSVNTSGYVYRQILVLKLIDQKTGRVVFESQAATTSNSPLIASVLRIMIRAMFLEFPGKSGSSRSFMLPKSI